MKFDVKINVNRPVAEVYKKMLDANFMTKWETNFKAYKQTGGRKRMKGGTGVRLYEEADGSTTKIKEETFEVNKNQSWRYHLQADNFGTEVLCQFLDQGETTVIKESSDLYFRPRILSVFAVFMKGAMKKRRMEDLKKFKAELEK